MKLHKFDRVIIFLLLSMTIQGQNFYDINTINTIEISFEETNWDYLLDNLYAEGNEERLVGNAVINGVNYDSVGVRYKGNSTYSANQIKNPLNIKLDHIINDQEIENYGTLKLANVYKDPSFVREVLSYEIAQKYMPASESNFTNVYINGTHLGLYTSVQSVDKHFMRTHFSSDDHPRFKGELLSSMPSLTTVWGYHGLDSANYYHLYELKSDEGWSDLVDFLDTLNNHNDEVESVLNLDRHLWMLAFDNLLVNLDAPINFAHNYYLYEDDAKRFNPIIWDLNESFGGFSMLLTGGGLTTTQMQQLDPFLNANSASFPIISEVLSNPSTRKKYVAHMKTMMEENFSNDWYKTRALEIQSIIDSDVRADPNKFYGYTEFLNNIDESVGGGGPPGPGNQPVVGITELMASRVSFLNTQAEFQATAPSISNVSNSPININPNSEVWINAAVTDGEVVQLALRYSQNTAFAKLDMLDDGNNNDGIAGDGIYGISVPTGSVGFQYYIYAENSEAASYLPAAAEYEFFQLTAVGDIVINEFLASNDTVIADQDGEYDDLIELFNNTNENFDLTGYHLSDDGEDLTQWTFPDTSIPAMGYLIIWTDNDEEQIGLHANFKLSASGEAIYLVNPSESIMDEVIFEAQVTDQSMGRIPNGTGPFTQISASFGAENTDGSTSSVDFDSMVPSIHSLSQNYPNPFNPETSIEYVLNDESHTKLIIYNLRGEEVNTLVNQYQSPGNYRVSWNGTNLYGEMMAGGMYIYTIYSGDQHLSRKMILLK